jgi:hypothetical protein
MSETQESKTDDSPPDLRTMLSQFITASNAAREADRIQHQQDISELKTSIKVILEGSQHANSNSSPSGGYHL